MTAPRPENPLVELAELLRLVANELTSRAEESMTAPRDRQALFILHQAVSVAPRRLEALRKLAINERGRQWNEDGSGEWRILPKEELTALYWIALGVDGSSARNLARIGVDSAHAAQAYTEGELLRNKRVGRKTLKALKEALADQGTSLGVHPEDPRRQPRPKPKRGCS